MLLFTNKAGAYRLTLHNIVQHVGAGTVGDDHIGPGGGGAFGSAATFGTLSAASAPGQPPVTLLKEKLISGEDL